jgi:hypothetical protein
MAKRKVGSQIGNLTPDHKKSGIDPTPVCAGGVQPVIGKFSTRATTLLQTSSRSELWAQSYSPAKLRKFQPWQFRDSPLGVSGQKAIWMWASRKGAGWTPYGEEATAPSSLAKSRKYKGGSRRHEMAASPSPKMWPWSHSALKACSILF